MTNAQVAHECGHATVAKSLGHKASISNFDKPRAHFNPIIESMPREHRLLIWAAGRAAVELLKEQGHTDVDPCEGFPADHRNMMEDCGCSEAEVEKWVERAKEIIKTNEGKWCEMRHRLSLRSVCDDEQQRLEQDEIEKIWAGLDPRLQRVLLDAGGTKVDETLGNFSDPRVVRHCLDHGEFFSIAGLETETGFVRHVPGSCHHNAIQRYAIGQVERKTYRIVQGFALSQDDVWHYHSWCAGKAGQIIETTHPRLKYFGFIFPIGVNINAADGGLGNELDRLEKAETRRRP